jgi:murein DD-endopeptidase MepM/ murein hydrolase activator NlpD
MRRLLPTARSFLIHSGQTAALVGAGLLAMAAAPLSPTAPLAAAPAARPEAPPVQAVAHPAGPVTRTIVFQAPLPGHAVNSPFGLRKLSFEAHARQHKGVDIAAPKGSSVYATAEGVVARTGYDAGGYGNFVELRHPNGMTSLYGHLSRIDVSRGRTIAGGDRLGLVGSTGRSTGPHLHFEVRRADVVVNPARVVGHPFKVTIAA